MCGGAIIHNICLPSNQQAAAPGAGQPAEKDLKISAVALESGQQKLDDELFQK